MKIGLLPLYLELYDNTCAFMRPRIEQFLSSVIRELEKRGMNIVCAPVCRLKKEFLEATKQFEEEGVAAIITLHLAYSPSLECIDALANTRLPLIVLDTTESYEFSPVVDSDEIMYNHGVHGVQDMCNLLRRHGKPFEIFAGHYISSDVLERVKKYCNGLRIAAMFRNARVGLVGKPFEGMGDFQVPFSELKDSFGIEIAELDMETARNLIADTTDKEIIYEKNEDKREFIWDESVTDEVYNRSAKVCIAIRKWIESEKLKGFTINFLATDESNPIIPVMPFTECSKAMARGVGYAGEGDVLTAALCGAVLQTFPNTSFTEIFCPDWKGGSVFLSHMGEINYLICAEKPRLAEKDFPYTSAQNPTVAYGTFKPGRAVLINLAPFSGGKYKLILATGEVLSVVGDNKLAQNINGWFKTDRPLPEFLEMFSREGGTHHSILSYENCLDSMIYFASEMGFEYIVI